MESRAVSELDVAFFKDHILMIQRIAASADPFIKGRLLQLTTKYEQGSAPAKRSTDLCGLDVKMSAER
jgi:hypothetical protein